MHALKRILFRDFISERFSARDQLRSALALGISQPAPLGSKTGVGILSRIETATMQFLTCFASQKYTVRNDSTVVPFRSPIVLVHSVPSADELCAAQVSLCLAHRPYRTHGLLSVASMFCLSSPAYMGTSMCARLPNLTPLLRNLPTPFRRQGRLVCCWAPPDRSFCSMVCRWKPLRRNAVLPIY